MKNYRLVRVLKVVLIVIVAVGAFGFALMYLWNWLIPPIFRLRPITFLQAVGLLILSKILFGGFHRHSGGRSWKRHMQERWAQMSPEEQMRFREGMRERRFDSPTEPASGQTSV